jgi:hypothetical protein
MYSCNSGFAMISKQFPTYSPKYMKDGQIAEQQTNAPGIYILSMRTCICGAIGFEYGIPRTSVYVICVSQTNRRVSIDLMLDDLHILTPSQEQGKNFDSPRKADVSCPEGSKHQTTLLTNQTRSPFIHAFSDKI